MFGYCLISFGCLVLGESHPAAGPSPAEILQKWREAVEFNDIWYSYKSTTSNYSPVRGTNAWYIEIGHVAESRDGRYERVQSSWSELEAPDAELLPNAVYVIHDLYRPNDPDLPYVSAKSSVKPPSTQPSPEYIEVHDIGPELTPPRARIESDIFGTSLSGIDYLLTHIDSVAVHEALERIGDSDCWVLEGVTEFGQIIIWLDPQHGYNLARLQLKQEAGDRINSRIRLPYVLQGVDKMPTRMIVAETTTIDRVSYRKIRDRWIQSGWHTTLSRHFRGKSPPIECESFFERTDIDLAPDFVGMKSFQIDVPDGTPVRAAKFKGINYVWKAGRVIPAVDDDAVRDIDRAVSDVQRDLKPK